LNLTRRDALVSLASLVSLALGACHRTNHAGAMARVVSVSPGTTETLFALDAGAITVGRSRYCDHPKKALALPVVGGFSDPSLEAIVALRPSLVVGSRGPAGPGLERALRERGIDTFFPETESIDGIVAMVIELGRRLERSAEAARVTGRIERTLGAVRAAVASQKRVRAALLFDVSPIVAAGPGGFPDELLREAGGDNVVVRGGSYPAVGLETLLTLDPDVLIDASAEPNRTGGRLASLIEAPGWRELRAVRTGGVRALIGSVALRPGPRVGEGVTELAHALHGKLDLPL
jgi:iron complex transport system substrate-binding protein